MDKHTETPDIGQLNFGEGEEEDVEDLFASPESGATTQKHTPSSQASTSAPKPPPFHHARNSSHSRQQTDLEARETRLRAELEKLREVNRVIENVSASLTKAKDNMETVNRTVSSASTLLATWTRILGQTEFNQRLILNPAWKGASQDLEDLENEDARRQQEAERRVVEEQRRREEAQRRAEEEERRKATAAAAGTGRGGSKTRGTRGSSSSSRGYVGVGGQSGRGRGTTGSMVGSTSGNGLGRAGSTRGRGRGLG